MTESIPSATKSSSADEMPSVRSRRRRVLPRFGLRTLLMFGLFFSLALGWIGKNLYRVRQEEAAIETLKRAGASIAVKTERGFEHHPATPYHGEYSADPEELPSLFSRALGIGGYLPVVGVELTDRDSEDALRREALAALATFPDLETVCLHGLSFDDSSIETLADLPKLNGIRLSDTGVTAEGWKSLAERSALRHVTLFREGSGDLIEGLPALKTLRSMQLADRGMSRRDIEVLASLPELTSLNLTAVTLEDDDVFVPLGEGNSLRDLSLSLHPNSRALTQRDVAAIARLPNVASLSIGGLDVSLLRAAEPTDTLRILRLYEPVTAEAAKEFSDRNPECLVQLAKPREEVNFLAGEEIELDAARMYVEEVRAAWADDKE